MNPCCLALVISVLILIQTKSGRCLVDGENEEISTWQGSWEIFPTTATWSFQTRTPMTTEFHDVGRKDRGKFKVKKKFRKFLLPLLLAYKLKFFTLIPVLIGGLVLLTGATGLAGFFFALFAAVMGLKNSGGH